MIKHGEIFTHNKQEIVLLLDRVLLSIDDKNDDEFVFATIKDININKTLYFVIANNSYEKFKQQYPKTMLAGFWHSLFVNNKIDLTVKSHYLSNEGLVYSLEVKNSELLTLFLVCEDEGLDSNIDTDLSKFEVLISPADKVKRQRLERTIKLTISGVFWLLIVIGLYLYEIQKDNKNLVFIQKISDIKQQISLQNHQIIKQKKAIYNLDKTTQENIKNLLFLRFKDINLSGEVNFDNAIVVKSSSDITLLKAFTEQYQQYRLKRHAEALPTLEFIHE